MKAVLSLKAYADLGRMDAALMEMFWGHVDKVCEMPPRRHLKSSVPYFAENVTRQARLACQVREDCILVIRCFSTHKEYESWLKSFR